MVLDSFITSCLGVSAEQGQRIVDRWNAVYPAMRENLNKVITAQRNTKRPLLDVTKLERVRRELGQVDRGTHRPYTCTREPRLVPDAALWLVNGALDAFYLGHPRLGDVYRLAAELADASAAHERAIAARSAARGMTT